MTGGDIAGLIAAGVFAVLVALMAVPLIKLGRVLDELRLWIRDLNTETEPLIDEVTRTVATANVQLEKVDDITANLSDASANFSAVSALVSSTVGQPFLKTAELSSQVRRVFSADSLRARRQRRHQQETGQAAADGRPQEQAAAAAAGADVRPAEQAPSSSADPSGSSRAGSQTTPWWEGTEWETPQDRGPAASTAHDPAPEPPVQEPEHPARHADD